MKITNSTLLVLLQKFSDLPPEHRARILDVSRALQPDGLDGFIHACFSVQQTPDWPFSKNLFTEGTNGKLNKKSP